MQRALEFIKGILTGTGVLLNTVVFCLIIYAVALLKYPAPPGRFRDAISQMLAGLAEIWISNNSLIMRAVGLRADLRIPDTLDVKGCYLLNCNHQTWVDIPVLQLAFNGRAPFMRFLLKKELIWVPFLGICQ